jgi:hypothetical protein
MPSFAAAIKGRSMRRVLQVGLSDSARLNSAVARACCRVAQRNLMRVAGVDY